MSVRKTYIALAVSAVVIATVAGCARQTGQQPTVQVQPVPEVMQEQEALSASKMVKRSMQADAVAMQEYFVNSGIIQPGIIHPEPSYENYQTFDDNPYLSPQTQPLSTFSLDVDTASFANVRRFINDGRLPPVDAVRTEELVNYFSYDYPVSDTGKPLSLGYELGVSPWNADASLLKVAMKAQDISSDKGANLVFLVDVSGSMNDANKLPLVKQSLKLLVKQLDADDRISLITYAGNVRQVLDATPGNQRSKILQAIDALDAGGGTYGEGGLKLAYNTAVEHLVEGGVNRVLLATDGDFNLGMTGIKELERYISGQRKQGVSLSVLGFGDGNYNDQLMETLSNAGDGNAAYIDSLQEARKVLSEQLTANFHTLAWDARIQVEFNPAVVQSYRLIGYENRQLADEAFLDERTDAGEVGAGQTVTALYELVLQNQPQTYPLRYQPVKQDVPEINEGELGHIRLRYKTWQGGSSEEQAVAVRTGSRCQPVAACSQDFRFAAAVAGYGQKLRNHQALSAFSWQSLADLARDAKGVDRFGYRAGFIQQLQLTAAL
ncbi:vWA domain-containing protein [Aliamphritea hakodatensis]|uniref:vWA domain-containing protein n=1 Tax=Aliamphritea hakodatensis TaxID=2895352 RepID=UPI0022FD7727|nr:VWA domain-containing protein [Aliamphritea hakodatensis]